MRRIFFLCWLLFLLVGVGLAQSRLDLLPGHGLIGAQVPGEEGFRLAVAGSVILYVLPAGENRAQVVDYSGAYRTIDLPAVAPYRPRLQPFHWPEIPKRPQFAFGAFSTLYDGLSLLLDSSAVGNPATAVRFEATLHLKTQTGRLGKCTVQVVRRGWRLPDPELDRLLERFLTAGPLPPLAGGEAEVDVVVVVLGGRRPVMTVWVSLPRLPGEPELTVLDEGVLYQEPLGLPPEVHRSRATEKARQAFFQDREQAASHLRELLDDANTHALFGQWHIDMRRTLQAVNEAMPDAALGRDEALMFLGGWAQIYLRREGEAVRWMEMVAAGATERALAEEAGLLARAWRRCRLVPPAPATATAAAPELFAVEAAMLEGLTGEPAQRLAGGLTALLCLREQAAARADFGLLIQARLAAAAQALSEIVADLRPAAAARAARQYVHAEHPYADRLLLDAGTLCLWRGRPVAAAEMFRLLLEFTPASALAPAAAWGIARADIAAGDREEALAVAATVEHQFSPDSAWHAFRAAALEEAPPEPWPFGPAVLDANGVRILALRLLRETYLEASVPTVDLGGLAVAERAARRLLDTTTGGVDRRPDWVALGHIFWFQGKLKEARLAYANGALQAGEDEWHEIALRGLGACVNPDAARVAAALKADPQWGAYVRGLLR